MSNVKELFWRIVGVAAASVLFYLGLEGGLVVVSRYPVLAVVQPHAPIIIVLGIILVFAIVLIAWTLETREHHAGRVNTMMEQLHSENKIRLDAVLDQLIQDHPFLRDDVKKSLWEAKHGPARVLTFDPAPTKKELH